MAKVLYLSYTGIMQPLGESQVMQYLLGLSTQHSMYLVSFERAQDLKDKERYSDLKQKLMTQGIHWQVKTYHKSPGGLATLYDVVILLMTVCYLQLKHRFDCVHCRSYVPSIAGLFLKRVFGMRFIFDMRGFWPDERVDGNIWRANSTMYRVAKWFERRFLLKADSIISLTHAGIDEIKKFDYLAGKTLSYKVIPTCTNLEIFRPYPKEEEGAKPLTIGFVGSVGTWYLFDDMVRCYKQLTLSNHEARLLVLNRSEQAYIRQVLEKHAIDMSKVDIRSVNYADVAKYMSQIDIALFFIKPVFSKKASAPTKMGEFLACGVPCLSNSGVGDVDTILQAANVGVCIDNFEKQSLNDAWGEIINLLEDPDLKHRCRDVAQQRFSLSQGVNDYDQVYKALTDTQAI